MSARADQYHRDAARCLRQAIRFRDWARQTGQRVDRTIMRRFAHHWRDYTRRACSARPLTHHA